MNEIDNRAPTGCNAAMVFEFALCENLGGVIG